MSSFPQSPFDAFLDAIAERNSEVAQSISDGRRMRTERGRAAVVQALLTLVNEGSHPTVADIARLSGVSERTVFRYLPDREAMYIATAVEIFPKIAHCITLHPPGADLDVRLRELITLRTEITQVGGKFAEWVESTDKPSVAQSTIIAMRGEQLQTQIVAFLSPEISGENEVLIPVINALLMHRPIASLLEKMSAVDAIDALFLAVRRMLTSQ